MEKYEDKFDFNLEFQWDILKYTLLDRSGYKALPLYHPSYFDTVDQQVIAKAISLFFNRRSKIPSKASMLLEQVKSVYRSREYVHSLKERDRDRINQGIKSLFKGGLGDSEEILEKILMFASYVEVKNIISKFDITNYTEYEKVSRELQQAVNKHKDVSTKRGTFLVGGIKGRVARRKMQDVVIPTPFYQLNRTTNAGGFTPGSIAVVMDKEKGGKTLSLVNVARGYLRKRRRVCFIDFENGQESIEDRIDQSVGNIKKRVLIDDEVEKSLKKLYRRYSRIGAELYVERMPASSSFNDIDNVFNRLKEDHGFVPDVLIVDYFILMNPTKPRTRDDLEVSQVYIDAKNFAHKWSLDCIWTANHIKHEAYKRRATRYRSGDAAKALDIGRNADIVIGINQNEDEERANILRWEIVDQRDGTRGSIVFKCDHSTQRLEELTIKELENFNKYKAALADEMDDTTSISDI